MTFTSSRNNLISGLLILLCLFLVWVNFFLPEDERKNQPPDWIFHLINFVIIIGLVWILLDTKYLIKDKFLFYRSGPIRGKIEIDKIRKIQHHSGLFVPLNGRPALDTNGLIITYNKFDDIYISPKDQQQFIEELLSINASIEII